MKRIALLGLLVVNGCKESSTPPPPPPKLAVEAPVVETPLPLPSNEQVLRDTLPRIERLAIMGDYAINPKKFVITKEYDQFEKDSAHATVHVNKSWFKVTAVYQRVGDFWKLCGVTK